MLSAISPGPPLHPHLILTDGGDDVQSDVALLRARGWTYEASFQVQVWERSERPLVTLRFSSRRHVCCFSPPGPRDVPSLSPAPGVDFHCRSVVFLSDRKFCAQPAAVEVQLLIHRAILRGIQALSNFWRRKKKKSETSHSPQKHPERFALSPLSHFVSSPHLCPFLFVCFSHLLFSLLIITKTKPFPSL